jgi:excisionase family DNA binding protein
MQQAIYLNGLELTQFQTIVQDAVNAAIETKLATFKPKEPTEYLSRKEVAQLLQISLPTLAEWTFSGKVIGYRIGHRLRYKRHEIEAALQTINTGK